MGDVLSQNEIDSLLAALSSGELDVEDMQEKDENKSRIMTFPDLPSSLKNILERWA